MLIRGSLTTRNYLYQRCTNNPCRAQVIKNGVELSPAHLPVRFLSYRPSYIGPFYQPFERSRLTALLLLFHSDDLHRVKRSLHRAMEPAFYLFSVRTRNSAEIVSALIAEFPIMIRKDILQ